MGALADGHGVGGVGVGILGRGVDPLPIDGRGAQLQAFASGAAHQHQRVAFEVVAHAGALEQFGNRRFRGVFAADTRAAQVGHLAGVVDHLAIGLVAKCLQGLRQRLRRDVDGEFFSHDLRAQWQQACHAQPGQRVARTNASGHDQSLEQRFQLMNC
ncbi:hypothetical protein D3C73_1015890 [compost metagenome]